ncbi:MAG: AI-2E family transporter [Acidobacteria bacterium]|nr:AI-2E family transporter [Acidobacteriota bacterium]
MRGTLSQLRWPQWLVGVIAAIALLVLCRLGAGLLVQSLALVRPVMAPILVALAISYLLEPLVGWIERRMKWSRSNAAVGATIIALLGFAFLLVVLLPPIVAQLVASARALPAAIRAVAEALQPWLMRLHDRYPGVYSSVVDRVTSHLSDTSHITDPIFNFFTGGLKQAVGIGSSLLNAILIPLFIFYILTDFRRLRDWLRSMTPARHRDYLSSLLDRIERVTSTFVRGQLLVAIIMSFLYVAGFLIAGVPLALSLGILAGFGYLIPYIGTFVAVVLTLLITVLSQPSWISVLGIASVYLVVQLIEGFILTPRLLGGRLRLHPMLVIVGLIVGGSQFGIAGVVLTMPVLAILKVIIEAATEPYRRSEFYTQAEPRSAESQELR